MQQRFLLQILLLAQHVSGTTMPIIWSSRLLYSDCCVRVMCPVLQDATSSCKPDTQPSAPHQTKNLKTTARNTTYSNHCMILLSS